MLEGEDEDEAVRHPHPALPPSAASIPPSPASKSSSSASGIPMIGASSRASEVAASVLPASFGTLASVVPASLGAGPSSVW